MSKISKRDKLSSGPVTTESLGTSSAAGLTEGIMGTAPLFPNYDDTAKVNKSNKDALDKED